MQNIKKKEAGFKGIAVRLWLLSHYFFLTAAPAQGNWQHHLPQ